MKNYIIYNDNEDNFVVCPVCHEIMDNSGMAFDDYFHIYDYIQKDNREIGQQEAGYIFCFGKCDSVYIVDPFTKMREVKYDELPQYLQDKISNSENNKYYDIYYANVKELVNDELIRYTADHKLSEEEIEILIKTKFNEETMLKYNVKYDDNKVSIYDYDLEMRSKKFNLGYRIDSYNPFKKDPQPYSNLLKCESANGKEFHFILSSD